MSTLRTQNECTMLAVLPLALGPAAQNIIIMSTGQAHICTQSCGLCELLGWHIRAGVGCSLLYSLASASALRLALACSSFDPLVLVLVLDSDQRAECQC